MNIKWNQVIVAFALGIMTGALAIGAKFASMGPPMFTPKFLLGRLSAELDLTKEQEGRVLEIFEANKPKLDAFVAETHQRLKQLRAPIKTEVFKVLTPEQQRKLDAWDARNDARIEARASKSVEPGDPERVSPPLCAAGQSVRRRPDCVCACQRTRVGDAADAACD